MIVLRPSAETWERLAERLERMTHGPSVALDGVDLVALQQGALALRVRAAEARRRAEDTRGVGT